MSDKKMRVSSPNIGGDRWSHGAHSIIVTDSNGVEWCVETDAATGGLRFTSHGGPRRGDLQIQIRPKADNGIVVWSVRP